MKKPISEESCLRIPVESGGARFEIDLRFGIPAGKILRGDDPVPATDWVYLCDRIRRMAAARPHRTPQAMAETAARAVLADANYTPCVEVAARRTDLPLPEGVSACSSMVFWRRKMDLGPQPPPSHLRKAAALRGCGALVKAAARPFHLLFPGKRWIMPPSDPARAPARSETPIPRIFWQTNFTDRCSLPVWLNYRRNRRLSDDFEHRYLGTEERAEYVARNAEPHVAAAYERLSDGAAQADLWRLVALYREGGVYLDIDATLVRPLSQILAGREAVYLWDRKRFSNYFMATVPGNPVFARFIDRVVDGIARHHERRERSVFYVTGPGALESVLDERADIEYLPRKSVALTGAFTDEKYQYIDRPRGKWIYNPQFINPAK